MIGTTTHISDNVEANRDDSSRVSNKTEEYIETNEKESSRVSDDPVFIVLGMFLAVLVLAIAVGTFFLLSRM